MISRMITSPSRPRTAGVTLGTHDQNPTILQHPGREPRSGSIETSRGQAKLWIWPQRSREKRLPDRREATQRASAPGLETGVARCSNGRGFEGIRPFPDEMTDVESEHDHDGIGTREPAVQTGSPWDLNDLYTEVDDPEIERDLEA